MEKLKSFFGSMLANWQGNLIMIAFWLILGILHRYGIKFVMLVPLNFLTGALLGIDESQFIGGTIGKIVVMTFFNGFITTMIMHKGGFVDKLRVSTAHYKDSLLATIPYFINLSSFDFKNTGSRYLNISGIGFGFVTYSFISGNGAFINSFVCLVLFLYLVEEAVEKRGLFTALINMFLSRLGRRQISKKPLDYFVNGYALGMLLTFIYAYFYGNQLVSYGVGTVLFIVGIVPYFLKIQTIRKELLE